MAGKAVDLKAIVDEFGISREVDVMGNRELKAKNSQREAEGGASIPTNKVFLQSCNTIPNFLMTHYKIHYSNKGAVTKINTSVIPPSAFSVVALISLNLPA